MYSLSIQPIYHIQNTLEYPVNYSIVNENHSILACGVIPPALSVFIHTSHDKTNKVYLLVSLWGYDYSEKMLIFDEEKKIQKNHRITIEKRKVLHSDPTPSLSLDVLCNHEEITIRAPFQFVNKTPFPLYV